MTRIKLYLFAATIALSGVGTAAAYVYHLGAERATLKQKLHASDSTVAALRGRSKALDTVYRTDTLRYRVAVTRWDTVIHNVSKWDTLRISVPADTVRLFVERAETAINACSVVVQTCEQRVATRDSIIDVLRKQRPLLLDERDGRGKRIAKDVAKVLAGATLGYIVGRERRDSL